MILMVIKQELAAEFPFFHVDGCFVFLTFTKLTVKI